jgi:30S ribosomal protein S31
MKQEEGSRLATFFILRSSFFSPDTEQPDMGKGDKRTKKGKIYRGSYGKRRPRKLKPQPKAAAKKRG